MSNEVVFGYPRGANRGLHLWPDEEFQSAGRAAVPASGIRIASHYTRYPSSRLCDSSTPECRALRVGLGMAARHPGCPDRSETSALSCDSDGGGTKPSRRRRLRAHTACLLRATSRPPGG